MFFFSHFQASSTRVRIFLKKEIFLSIVEKKASTRSVFELVFAPPHEDATKNGITIASLTGHALYDVWHDDIVFENLRFCPSTPEVGILKISCLESIFENMRYRWPFSPDTCEQ